MPDQPPMKTTWATRLAAVDGAVADQFLARVQHTLENFDESLL